MATLQDVLETAPLFSGFVDSDLAALAGALRPRELAAGECLFRQGQAGDSMTIVVSGEFGVFAQKDGQERVKLATIRPGDVVGEMSAIDPAPRSATVEATTSSKAYILDRSMLSALQVNAAGMYTALLRGIGNAVTRRLRQTNESILDATFGSARLTASNQTAVVTPPGAPFRGRVNLDGIDSLSGLTEAELAKLGRVVPAYSYGDGQLLCQEGEPGNACFIVGGGKVNVVRTVGQHEQVLATLNRGAFVGQLALLHDTRRCATVRANGAVWLLVFSRKLFQSMLQSREPLALKLQEQVIIAGIRQLRSASQALSEAQAAAKADEEEEVQPRPPVARPQTPAPRPRSTPRARASTQERTRPRAANQPQARTFRPSDLGLDPVQPNPAPLALDIDFNDQKKSPISEWLGAPDSQAPEQEVVQPKQARKRSGKRKRTPTQEMAMYFSTALQEWGMTIDEIDNVSVSIPEGQITAAEMKARKS